MKKRAWISVILALTLAGPAGGQVMAAGDGIYHLGEVVVPGKQKSVEKVGTTHTVTARQIEERGARSLDEAIKLVPGVQLRVGNDGTPRVDMRGFRTRHVTLLLNGTPFNGTYDGQFDPALISVENIAEIKVTTGGGSTLYGPGGNAGVINIITKKAVRGLSGSIGAELGEAGTRLERTTLSYGGDKYDIFVSASNYDRDRFLMSHDFNHVPDQPDDSRRNSDRRRNNLFANIGFTPSDATQIGWTISYLEGERGKPPVTNDGVDDYANKLKYEREDFSENISTQLALSHDFTGPLSFKGWGYYNALDLHENGYDDFNYNTKTKNGASSTHSKTQIAGVNTQLRYDAQEYGAATLGLMFENDDWRAHGFSINKKGRSDFRDNADFQLYSVSLEYEVQPVEHLEVVVGAGQHWQHRDDDTENDYSYLIGASYQLFESTRLKASHTRKVRFPSLRDLYDPERGNLNLDAEVSKHYEAGVEQQLPAETFFSITGYYAVIDDYIERPENADQVRNYDTYQFKGFEVAIENRYFNGLWVRASYDHIDSKDRSPDSNRSKLQYRPEHRVTFETTYALPWWGLSAYGAVWWVADSYYNPRQNVTTNPQKTLDNYYLADCRINKKTVVGGTAVDVYFGVNNLFDENYEQSYGLDQAGQTFYGGVNWKF